MKESIRKLADISSRGGKVPPWYLYLIFILPGLSFSVATTGKVNYIPFILISVAILPLIAATNLFDDYFDYVKGIDRVDSPNTRYRRHPVFYYGVDKNYLLKWALIFSSIYFVFIFAVSLRYGAWLNLIGAVGFVLSYGYTGPPLGYKYRALGEIGVFFSSIVASTLIVLGTVGEVPPSSILFFVPFSTLIALVLFVGNFRDLEVDKVSGIETLAVKLGKQNSEVCVPLFFTLFYVLVALFSLVGIFTRVSLLDLLTAPFAFYLTLKWTDRDSALFERYTGPYIFVISMLLIFLTVL